MAEVRAYLVVERQIRYFIGPAVLALYVDVGLMMVRVLPLKV